MAETVSRPLILSLICILYMFIGVLGSVLCGLVVIIELADGISDMFLQMVLTFAYALLLLFAGIKGWKGEQNSWVLLVLSSLLVIAVNGYYNSPYDTSSKSSPLLIVLALLYLLFSSKAKAYLNSFS